MVLMLFSDGVGSGGASRDPSVTCVEIAVEAEELTPGNTRGDDRVRDSRVRSIRQRMRKNKFPRSGRAVYFGLAATAFTRDGYCLGVRDVYPSRVPTGKVL